MAREFLFDLTRGVNRSSIGKQAPGGVLKLPKLGMWNYLQEVRSELKHVSWPTRRLTIVYTAVVIGVSVFVAVYLGLLDFIFSSILKQII